MNKSIKYSITAFLTAIVSILPVSAQALTKDEIRAKASVYSQNVEALQYTMPYLVLFAYKKAGGERDISKNLVLTKQNIDNIEKRLDFFHENYPFPLIVAESEICLMLQNYNRNDYNLSKFYVNMPFSYKTDISSLVPTDAESLLESMLASQGFVTALTESALHSYPRCKKETEYFEENFMKLIP